MDHASKYKDRLSALLRKDNTIILRYNAHKDLYEVACAVEGEVPAIAANRKLHTAVYQLYEASRKKGK